MGLTCGGSLRSFRFVISGGVVPIGRFLAVYRFNYGQFSFFYSYSGVVNGIGIEDHVPKSDVALGKHNYAGSLGGLCGRLRVPISREARVPIVTSSFNIVNIYNFTISRQITIGSGARGILGLGVHARSLLGRWCIRGLRVNCFLCFGSSFTYNAYTQLYGRTGSGQFGVRPNNSPFRGESNWGL